MAPGDVVGSSHQAVPLTPMSPLPPLFMVSKLFRFSFSPICPPHARPITMDPAIVSSLWVSSAYPHSVVVGEPLVVCTRNPSTRRWTEVGSSGCIGQPSYPVPCAPVRERLSLSFIGSKSWMASKERQSGLFSDLRMHLHTCAHASLYMDIHKHEYTYRQTQQCQQ